jgi:hypothetical protein
MRSPRPSINSGLAMTGKECHCEELSPCHCEELSPAVIARSEATKQSLRSPRPSINSGLTMTEKKILLL